MSEPASAPSQLPETAALAAEVRSLASGIRAVTLIFTLFVSYCGFRLSYSIFQFSQLFQDMLGGRPLPAITTLVIAQQTPLVLLSMVIPLAAILVTVFVRNHRIVLYSNTTLIALGIIQSMIIWNALSAPLRMIINGMQGW